MTPLAGASLSILLAFSPAAASAALAPAEGPLRGGQTVTFDAPSPPDPPKIVRISGGNHSSLAIGDDSKIYGWGGNGDGEVGSAEPGSQVVPVRSQTPAGVTFDDVAVGSFTSYAVGSDEKTYAWGSGQHGALGNGSTSGSTQAPSEVKLPTGTKFTRVIAGEDHAFGIDESGNAFAWGTNASRQLGDGSFTYIRATPVPVLMPAGVTFTDLSALAEHTLAVGSDGNTYAWGTNSAGLLGTSSLPRPLDRPTKVATPPGVKYTQVAAGWEFSVALGTDGKLYSWGSNYQGTLGNGSDEWESQVPVRAATPPGVLFQRVVSGGSHVLALTVDGQIYAWGSNSHGELGNGTTSPSGSPTPVLVQAPTGVTFVGISAGSGTSFARGSDGLSYSWGSNAFGQLGDGTRTDLAAPSPVLPPEMKSTVTGVTFGDRPGSHITESDSGVVSAQTPAGEKYGPVDVGVEWTVNGDRQEPVSLPQAYLYGDAPHVTALVSQESQLGAEAEFSTHPSGSPSPELAWEFSLDGGGTWLPTSEDSAVRVSDDGQTLSVSVAPQHEQVLYRAVARNVLGTARTLPAELRVPSRTVSFDSTGGSPVDAQSVLSGGTVTEPENAPERSKFEFVGWIDTSGVPFDFSAPIVSDTIVFADWRAAALPTFEVNFDLAGGSGTFPQQSIEAGGKVVFPADTPTRDGYAFTGWTLDGAIYDFGAPVERDLSLVAGWHEAIVETHTVTFDPHNGSESFTQEVPSGEPVSRPADPVRAGFTFTGWASDGVVYDFASPVTSDVFLTAG
ncbi:RCC1 domain-containing protein, partial [Leucobacter sp. BZR 635]